MGKDFIMKEEDKNKNLRSRREFFKKAAKGVLPLLGVAALISAPKVAKAAETPQYCQWDCTFTCRGGCQGCTGACTGGCSGGCSGGCYGGCNTACTGYCRGTCHGACRNFCVYGNAY